MVLKSLLFEKDPKILGISVILTLACHRIFIFLPLLTLLTPQSLPFLSFRIFRIVSLDMNPASDQVVTGSFDNTVRFWDLNMPECTAVLTMEAGPKSRPLVAFDPSGKLIAVASVPWVRLYNLAQLERGPFLEFNLEDSLRSVSTHRCQGRLNPTFTSCKFDPTGVHIMLVTNQGLTLIVDSFAGTLETVLGDFEVSTMTATEACFSPDSQYVLRGSLDGTVRCWNRKTAHLVKQWENMHSGAVRCIKFNPVALNFTSTCSHINMWLPKLRSKQQPSEHSSSSNDS